MSAIIEIQSRKIIHGPCGWSVDFQAVVDDIVQVSAATRYDPPQYASAVCDGSVLLGDEPLPTTHREFLELAELVDNWQPINNY